jgi:hypothetical protein
MCRLPSRVASMLLLAAGVVTCSESPTSVRRAPVRLSFTPRFSTHAEAIYRDLSAFSVTLDKVHVVIRGESGNESPGPVLKDTTVTFPAGQDQVAIDIDLSIAGAEETVVADVGLLEGATVYFEGAVVLVAKRGETAGSPEPVAMSYVGPGLTAEFMSVTPPVPTMAPSSTFQFVVAVFDHLEHPVTDLPVTWSTGDPTIATVSQTGLVTSLGKAGTTTLTVKGLNGISTETTLDVQPVAALNVVSGAAQTGIAGSALQQQFQVQAVDASGAPVIGAAINFSAAQGASVVPANTTTDAGGYASAVVTLGQAATTYTFVARATDAPGVAASVTASASAGVPASLGIAAGDAQADTVLATLQPLTVKVIDGFGNPVSNQIVDFLVTSGSAGLLPVSTAGAAAQVELQVATGADGAAAVSLATGAVAGVVKVTASVPQTTLAAVTFSETLQAGNPARFVMLQQPSKTAQATIPLGTQPKVQVTDLYGNAVALGGVLVTAEPSLDCVRCVRVTAPRTGAPLLDRTPAPAGRRSALLPTRRRLTPVPSTTSRLIVPVTIARTTSVSDTFPVGLGGTTTVKTDASGIATFTDISLDLQVVTGGAWRLTFADTANAANAGFGAAVSDDIVLSPGPITSIIAWGIADNSLVPANDTLNPSVKVIDAVGNGIPGVSVTWTTNDGVSKLGSAALDTVATTTDIDGIATPGIWVVPGALSAPMTFDIVATPKAAPNVENAPLHLYATP